MVNSIEITNLNYLNIFDNLTLKIEKNKITSISGPNNCGKTTLIKILSRSIYVDQNILINNTNLNDYKMTDYFKIVKAIFPLREIFMYEIVEDELSYYIDQLFLSREEKNKRLKNIRKNLGINKIKSKKIKELSQKEFIQFQLALAIAAMPKIILIDDLSPYLDSEEIKKIIAYFKYLIKNYDLTIIFISTRLEDIIDTDYLYILNESKIILQGKPLEVLQKDNVLNRIGLKVPFMIDLSVKLKDYNLVKEVELDMNRMTEKLWN